MQLNFSCKRQLQNPKFLVLKLGDPWNVPCLISFRRRKWNIIFISFNFSFHKILLKHFFINFRVLLYHGSKSLRHVFPFFSFTYKLQSHNSRYQSFGDKLEIIYESLYESENTLIFAWSLIFGIGHYHWLFGSIHQLPFNSKANYLVCTFQCILYILQLWITTMTLLKINMYL
jgi:hypothetical protein